MHIEENSISIAMRKKKNTNWDETDKESRRVAKNQQMTPEEIFQSRRSLFIENPDAFTERQKYFLTGILEWAEYNGGVTPKQYKAFISTVDAAIEQDRKFLFRMNNLINRTT